MVAFFQTQNSIKFSLVPLQSLIAFMRFVCVYSRDPAYLSAAGKAVYNALTAADPQAVW